MSITISFNAYQKVNECEKVCWCLSHSLNHRNLNAAYEIREQLCNIVERHHLPVNSNTMISWMEKKRNIKRCLCHGFFLQSAIFDCDGNYLTAKDNQVVIVVNDSLIRLRVFTLLLQFSLLHNGLFLMN